MNPRGLRLLGWLVVAGCGALIALDLAWSLRAALDEPWNDARLAPTVAMVQGMPTCHPRRPG